MRSMKIQSQQAQHPPSSSSSSSSSSSIMSPLSTASITVAALLLLTTPPCLSAPVDLQQATPLRMPSQIEVVCSSYLSADLQHWVADVLQELCVLMLVQKSKPLRRVAPPPPPRRERGLSMHAELQGPGGIQSRGFFLYRPRNGRRFLESE